MRTASRADIEALLPRFIGEIMQTPPQFSAVKIEGQRAYAAGGVATLDLMLALIAKHYGEALANEVANALIHAPRESPAPQRLVSHRKSAVEKLEPAAEARLRARFSEHDHPGAREIIAWLRQRARPYLFSNTLAPSIAAANRRHRRPR